MDTKEKKTRRNPQETANPISRLFFWWTLSLFHKGARGNLEMDDLYDPVRSDKSERLGNRLEREWNVELEKLKNVEYALDEDGKKINIQRPSLTRAIFRAFWLKYLNVGMFMLLQAVVLRTMQPILSSLVIKYFSDGDPDEIPTQREALWYAAGLVFTTLGITFIMHHTNLDAQQIGMRVRVACSSLVYRKSLRLSKSSLSQTAAGQVVNLLSNDVNRFDLLPMFLNYVWIMPLQLIVVGYVMWQSVGVSAIIGIGALLMLAIPIQGYLSKISGKLRARTAKLTDRRVQLMSELIAGIQVVKMYAWEKPFEMIVSRTRAREIGVIIKSSNIRGLYLGIMVFTERTTLFLTLVSFVVMGNTLTANVTYEIATYFNILQMTAAIFFPQALIMCGETVITIKRLENFLLLDEVTKSDEKGSITDKKKLEVEESRHILSNDRETKRPVSVELYRVSANWISGILPPTICDVSLKINGGELCALVGSVGSGKSSLLNVLLRELPLGAGTIKLLQYSNDKMTDGNVGKPGYVNDNPRFAVSYASQDAWLFVGTVRENILFGQPYDKKRYQEVTSVCALARDFRQFPEGDMTIVGERGAVLSGGQRARINLARAIYRQADLYLLDDPLSAVDAKVGRHLFANCIVDYLRGKTRILVTHQLQFLKRADTIVVMDRGAVKHQGSWDELMRSCPDFKEMLSRMEEEKKATIQPERKADEEDDTALPEDSLENQEANETLAPRSSDVGKWTSFRGSQDIPGGPVTDQPSADGVVADRKYSTPTHSLRAASTTPETLRRVSVRSMDSFYSQAYEDDEPPNGTGNANDQEESKATGRLATRVYTSYFRAGGGIFLLILLVANMVLAQVATSGTDYWLSYWTNLEATRTGLHNPSLNASTIEYNSIVNDRLFVYFNILDEEGLLPTEYAIYIYTFCILSCIVLILARSFLFMRICMVAGRTLHNTMFANVLQAMMSFFNANPSGRILNRFSKDVGAIDELLPKAMLEALQIFLVMIGILVMVAIANHWMIIPMIIIAIVFYLLRIYYLSTAQDIKRLEGIAKSPVFSHVNATLNGLTTIRSSGNEIQIKLRKEFDDCQDTHTGAWYLYLATASSFGLALDLVSCLFVTCVCYSFILINSDETLGGYVGLAISQSLILTGMLQYGIRQSAEVQSQMTAVERILQYTDLPKEGPMTSRDPPPPNWPNSGRVILKGVSMRYNNQDPPVLKDLNLSIEAGWKIGVIGRTGAGKSSLISALFRLTGDGLEGEIKIDDLNTANIGLHELRSSISIIPQEPVLFSESLRYNLDPFGKYSDSDLWDTLREVELADVSLDQRVTEGGTNFSVGQRQLICLARAILRNNRVLVLDEATANIDARTDALIQRTIRSKFANCTVITIAHRLNTIIDSDRVLVMGDGRIVEYGSPYELLFMKENSHFAQMLRQTGEAMAQTLKNFVASAHRRSNSQSQISAL